MSGICPLIAKSALRLLYTVFTLPPKRAAFRRLRSMKLMYLKTPKIRLKNMDIIKEEAGL